MEGVFLSEVPWFALSPSPFSIIFYFILIFYGIRKLLKTNKYRRWKYVNAFAEAFFILGLIVLIGDCLWIVACGLRFGTLFPDSLPQLGYSFARNIAGLALCFLLVGNDFKRGLLSFKPSTYLMFYVNCIFLLAWFGLSSSPAYTDWTFAIRYDYPFATVLLSFLVSHVIGKGLVASIYYTIWGKR